MSTEDRLEVIEATLREIVIMSRAKEEVTAALQEQFITRAKNAMMIVETGKVMAAARLGIELKVVKE